MTVQIAGGNVEASVVYHYTTMEAMMEIVRGASIWATSIWYLNDTTEGEHFLQLVRQKLPDYLRNHPGQSKDIFHLIEASRDNDRPWIERAPFTTRPFLASFSGEPDSLQHWRSYCPKGNGVSLGFRVECLKRAFVSTDEDYREYGVDPAVLTRINRIKFQAVEYGYNSDVLEETISDAIERAKKQCLSSDQDQSICQTNLFANFMIEKACLVKHPAFAKENEYRLVVPSAAFLDKFLAFRMVRTTLVPYLNVRIPRKTAEAQESRQKVFWSREGIPQRVDFIDRVVIGPTPNMILSHGAVEGFFNRQGMGVEVSESSVPYRDW